MREASARSSLGLDSDASQPLLRSSIAALVCACGTVVTSAALAGRAERSPALAAVNGGLALASAVFAVATATAALAERRAAIPIPRAQADASDARDALEQISRIAQAGALGDADAAQHAFAMIARRTRDSLASLPPA